MINGGDYPKEEMENGSNNKKQIEKAALTTGTRYGIMFAGMRGGSGGKKGKYSPGVYTTNLALNDNNVEIRVEVDENRINSISMGNLDEAVATMYPLLQPTFDQIVQHIYEKQSLDDFSYEEESKHTSKVLLKAIQEALDQAVQEE